ncbi:amidohydrolase [Cohnella faecalis]|uniref:Amidohydrolase n=2 Tax=Cohnella faecalis TaxID=2315694 RepID=A0A398CZ60_9BACL|nr:amidohydrolase [Cohnella faecalis]
MSEQERETTVRFYRHLHRHPELSFEEQRTSALVAEELRKLGYRVRERAGKFGVIADLEGAADGPTVALRADMDALPIEEETGLPFASTVPGVMHACGHDAHTAMLLVAARILASHRGELRGRLRLLFQSAEEINAGAKAMIGDGGLEGVAEIYGLHNWPALPAGVAAVKEGALMGAVDRLDIEVRGRGGHGAIPDLAADPIVASSAVVLALQTAVSRELSPFEPSVVTIGSFHGGHANNVIPDRSLLTGTVRTLSPKARADIRGKLIRLISKTAEAYNCSAEVEYTEQVPAVINDSGCAVAVREALVRTFGTERVRTADPTMAGEDFAVYQERVPGCFFWIGSGPKQGSEAAYGLHHPKFRIDEDCLPAGVAALVSIALARLAPS